MRKLIIPAVVVFFVIAIYLFLHEDHPNPPKPVEETSVVPQPKSQAPAWRKSDALIHKGTHCPFDPALVEIPPPEGGDVIVLQATPEGKGSEIMSARDDFMFGSYRARLKMSEESGVVNAMMFYGGGKNEIDIEYIPKEGNFIHLACQPSNPRDGSYQKIKLPFDPAGEFHEYGFDWYSDRVEFFIDGEKAAVITNHVPAVKGQVVFSNWTGLSNWGGKAPARLSSMYLKDFSYTPIKNQEARTCKCKGKVEENRKVVCDVNRDGKAETIELIHKDYGQHLRITGAGGEHFLWKGMDAAGNDAFLPYRESSRWNSYISEAFIDDMEKDGYCDLLLVGGGTNQGITSTAISVVKFRGNRCREDMVPGCKIVIDENNKVIESPSAQCPFKNVLYGDKPSDQEPPTAEPSSGQVTQIDEKNACRVIPLELVRKYYDCGSRCELNNFWGAAGDINDNGEPEFLIGNMFTDCGDMCYCTFYHDRLGGYKKMKMDSHACSFEILHEVNQGYHDLQLDDMDVSEMPEYITDLKCRYQWNGDKYIKKNCVRGNRERYE